MRRRRWRCVANLLGLLGCSGWVGCATVGTVPTQDGAEGLAPQAWNPGRLSPDISWYVQGAAALAQRAFEKAQESFEAKKAALEAQVGGQGLARSVRDAHKLGVTCGLTCWPESPGCSCSEVTPSD